MRSQLWRDVLPHVQDAQKRVLPFLPKLRPARYGFAAGVAMLFRELPLGHFFQPHFCFIGLDQIRHIGQTSNTRKLFCKRRFTLRQNQAGAGGRPRILRRFLSESKSSTATARDCLETKGQSEMISLMASLAASRSCTKRNPLLCGKYFDPPVSSVTTGRPIARNVAARSLSQPVCQATSTPLIAVNSALADAT